MPSIFICGDFLHSGYYSEVIFEASLEQAIQCADYAICNFEAPVESDGAPIKKAGPHLQQKTESVMLLKETGFDLLLLANNHIFDYGRKGLQNTLDAARQAGIETIGAGLDFDSIYTPLIKDINGVRFGFINGAEEGFGVVTSPRSNFEFEGGYAWINHSQISDTITQLKKEVDFLVCFVHAGLEECDIPLIEWRNCYKRLCDQGADCVVASHPHCLQGFEKHNDSLIFYSLGNFYFPEYEKSRTTNYACSLFINFDLNSGIIFEPVYHLRKENILRRVDESESPISLKKLSLMLQNEHYNKKIERVYLEAYEEVCYRYYSDVFNTVSKHDSLSTLLKKIVKQIFFPERHKEARDLLLFHLNKNETYRFITQRALSIKINNRS